MDNTNTLWVDLQNEFLGIRFIAKTYEFMIASFEYGN
jgi:hypothetical protein